jgi:hypothetical protein
LAKLSHSRAKQGRVVLRLALELAVRHEILPSNPMDYVSRLYREPHLPDALTAPEVNVIRAAIAQGRSPAELDVFARVGHCVPATISTLRFAAP